MKNQSIFLNKNCGDYLKLTLYILSFFTLLFWGCETTSYITYQARPTTDTDTFYSNGIPITSYIDNQEFILFTAEEASLLNEPYIRVWLLIKNNSDSTYVVKPYNIIELTAIKPIKFQISSSDTVILKADSLNYWPQSPTEILKTIDAEKNASMILTSIGGALKAISVKGTTLKDNNGNTYKLNDKKEKREKIFERTNGELNNTQDWYDIFENSFNSGVLRVNTLFPHNAVNGYVYFPLTDADGATYLNTSKLNDYIFEIKLNLNNKIKVVELSPFKVW